MIAANNYASSLADHKHFRAARSLFRKILPVAPRVLGESNDLTLRMRWIYAEALYRDDGATLDDLREAVTTLEDAERIARRVFGGAHPLTTGMEDELQDARAALCACETPPASETAATAAPDSAVPASPPLAGVVSKFKEAVSVGNDTPSPRSAEVRSYTDLRAKLVRFLVAPLLDARKGRDGVVEDVAQHRARPRVAPRQRIIEFGRNFGH